MYAASSIFMACVVASCGEPPAGYHPVVNVAGLTGSALEAKNTNFGYCHSFGWQQIWGVTDLTEIVKMRISCMVEDMTLAGWNDKDKLSIEQPGIEIRPVGGYESFTPISKLFGMGMNAGENGFLPALRAVGFVENKHMFGHGYDWRLGVHDWERKSFPHLRDMIERAVKIADGRGVILTGISMACPYNHAFLKWMRSQDKTWAARHVHVFAPVSGPWNGAVDAMAALLSQLENAFNAGGNCPTCLPVREAHVEQASSFWGNVGSYMLETISSHLTPAAHSWPSMYFVSPGVDFSTTPPTDPVAVRIIHSIPAQCKSPSSTVCGAVTTRNGWPVDHLQPDQCGECIIKFRVSGCPSGYSAQDVPSLWTRRACCKMHKCSSENYKASELHDLYAKVGRREQAQMQRYANEVETTSDPQVPVHCIFGHNVITMTGVSFVNKEVMAAEGDEVQVFGDGDGTVHFDSLDVCTRWASTEKVYKVPNVAHATTLMVAQVSDLIKDLAINNELGWRRWKDPEVHELKFTDPNMTSVPSQYVYRMERPTELSVLEVPSGNISIPASVAAILTAGLLAGWFYRHGVYSASKSEPLLESTN